MCPRQMKEEGVLIFVWLLMVYKIKSDDIYKSIEVSMSKTMYGIEVYSLVASINIGTFIEWLSYILILCFEIHSFWNTLILYTRANLMHKFNLFGGIPLIILFHYSIHNTMWQYSCHIIILFLIYEVNASFCEYMLQLLPLKLQEISIGTCGVWGLYMRRNNWW